LIAGFRFNPRAREGRDLKTAKVVSRTTCFNPRAREGRDARDMPDCGGGVWVSIHAPARGATSAGFYQNNRHLVSIHAPARGATYSWVITALKGDVSIHAPARGATDVDGFDLDIAGVSIHAPARGATCLFWPTCNSLVGFQSTRPRGARLGAVG